MNDGGWGTTVDDQLVRGIGEIYNECPDRQGNEVLKCGIHSLDIPDRMRRYQHVLSLLPE
jgi:hypothetical protein